MKEKNDCDVLVIGGGPGGYVAAIRAAQLGQKTILVEKENLGGICLNWGCIPTKSLLKSAELYEKIKHADDYGISVGDASFNIEKIVERSRVVSTKLVKGIESLLKKNKVSVIRGTAKFNNSKEVIVNTQQNTQQIIKAKNIIIATGARARILKGFEPNNKNIWTYREALSSKKLPKSMVIVGSGAIGMEFACFYSTLGVDVTVLEAANRILPVEDQEISFMAKKAFEAKGIKFNTGIELERKEENGDSVTVFFKSNKKEQKSLQAEILLMAVGIVGNSENLGLEKTKVKIERNHIVTDDYMCTAESNIYAIGDVASSPWLAHKASHEGIIAAENISNVKTHKMNKTNIPACTYSSPQIASVGLTEEQAMQQGYKIKIGRFPFYANGKALILNDSNGLVKTIFDEKTGELLGAHMIGTDVTELIQGYVVAKTMEGTEIDLMNTIFPHPTLSEMMHESVLQAFGKQIHI